MSNKGITKLKNGISQYANAADSDGLLITSLIEALALGDSIWNIGPYTRASHSPSNYSLGGDTSDKVNNHLAGIDTAIGGKLGSGVSFGGDVSGTYAALTVAKIQGRAVHNAAPADGNVLTWDNANSRWAPAAPSGGIPDPGTKVTNDIIQYNGSAWEARGGDSAAPILGVLYSEGIALKGSAKHIVWMTDGGGNIGGASDLRPEHIYAKTEVKVGDSVRVRSDRITLHANTSDPSGLASGDLWYTNTGILRLIDSGSGNRVIAHSDTTFGGDGGDVSGKFGNLTVRGLQGRTVATTAPTKSQSLLWAGSQWVPAGVGSGAWSAAERTSFSTTEIYPVAKIWDAGELPASSGVEFDIALQRVTGNTISWRLDYYNGSTWAALFSNTILSNNGELSVGRLVVMNCPTDATRVIIWLKGSANMTEYLNTRSANDETGFFSKNRGLRLVVVAASGTHYITAIMREMRGVRGW